MMKHLGHHPWRIATAIDFLDVFVDVNFSGLVTV